MHHCSNWYMTTSIDLSLGSPHAGHGSGLEQSVLDRKVRKKSQHRSAPTRTHIADASVRDRDRGTLLLGASVVRLRRVAVLVELGGRQLTCRHNEDGRG